MIKEWIRKTVARLNWEWRKENKFLIENFKRHAKQLPNNDKKIFNKVINSAEKLIEIFFNVELYGFYAMQPYSREMSIAKFRKVYSVIFAYYFVLIQSNGYFNNECFTPFLEELEVDRYTFNKSFSDFRNIADLTELGRKAWSNIAEIIEYDETKGLRGILCGSFVIFSQTEWKKLEKFISWN